MVFAVMTGSLVALAIAFGAEPQTLSHGMVNTLLAPWARSRGYPTQAVGVLRQCRFLMIGILILSLAVFASILIGATLEHGECGG